jgi:hypothetical protein
MTRIARSQARRRRAFVALSVVTVVALGVILWPKGSSGGTAGPSTSAPPTSIAPPDSSTPPDTVAAWLAWMPGGFPEPFRHQIPSASGITKDVIVEGDTLWMTASHDTNDDVIDQPPSPYTTPTGTRPSCPRVNGTRSSERSGKARPSWASPPRSSVGSGSAERCRSAT